MKIIKDDCIYIQIGDLAYILDNFDDIPTFIINELFRNGNIVIDIHSEHEFVSYSSLTLIRYFKNLKSIIDYDKLKGLSENELVKYYNDLELEMFKLGAIYTEMTDEEKELNIDILNKYNLLNVQKQSFLKYIQFLEGKTNVKLPEGIEYPKEFKTKKKHLFK